jgi:glycosyltransferase involved in cell wall biosynthesis
MLTGHNIIYFGYKWAGMLRNRQQLMSVFARQNKVLFIEREQRFKETLRGFRHGKLGLPDLCRSPVRQISENLFVFHHPVWASTDDRFPFLLKQLTKMASRISLRNAVRKLQMSEPIVWFSHPDWLDWIDAIPSTRLRLYHVFDEFTSHHNLTLARHRQIEEQEKAMMAQVDAIIVVSKELYEAKRPFNANTYLVPNGADHQAYSDALATPYLPDKLQSIKTPRLGYSGSISDKLNLSMLKKLARGNPDWSMVFLGRVTVSQQAEIWRALQAMPNVHYLGLVAWSQVPHYVKGFDVGLMPYLQDRHSETISPLKLYDYLAAGLPIASMDIPAAREFIPHIHLAESPRDFSQAVRNALADTMPEHRQARRNIAAQHTWEARVEQLSDIIQAQLIAKAQNNGSG